MDCETLVHLLSAYLDGELDEEKTVAAENHLATCQNCRTVARSTQAMIQAYRSRGEQIPTQRRHALLAFLKERLEQQK